jgi:lysophospholipase L1-like esterase
MPIYIGGGRYRAAIILCALLALTWLSPHHSRAASDSAPAPKATMAVCTPMPYAGKMPRLEAMTRRLQTNAPIRVLAIGSSSTQGIGASTAARTYPAQLKGDLEKRWPKAQFSVINAGIGGETAAATLDRLERLLASQKFDLVIWQLGTNDAVKGDDPKRFRELTLRGIAAARAAGNDLILLDPQYYPGIRDLAEYERFVTAISELGEQERVPVFRRYAMMKRLSEDGEANLLAYLAADRFHMNDEGYGCLARALTADIGRMTQAETVASVQSPLDGVAK